MYSLLITTLSNSVHWLIDAVAYNRKHCNKTWWPSPPPCASLQHGCWLDVCVGWNGVDSANGQSIWPVDLGGPDKTSLETNGFQVRANYKRARHMYTCVYVHMCTCDSRCVRADTRHEDVPRTHLHWFPSSGHMCVAYARIVSIYIAFQNARP